MPCVTTHAVMSCMHHTVHACRQAGHPYVNVACQELLMDTPFTAAKLYLRKLTASHFSTLNMKIANQNVLKRILIAMHNENKADWNENFRICAEDITITFLVLVHFGLIKDNQGKIHQYFQHTSSVERTCFYSLCRSSSSQFGC